jgi:hypothetical protein
MNLPLAARPASGICAAARLGVFHNAKEGCTMSNIDLEASVNDAATASTALALALRGIDKLAIEQEDEQMAIQ